MKLTKILPIVFIFIVVCVFFRAFFLNNLLPIPSDTIIGLYHPFRDLYAKDYPNGIPYKNSLITDPVRQQYPWRFLSITQEKLGNLPLWNPYSFSGYPLLANIQSASLYPLNILFFILPFSLSWSILIILQPMLGGIFLYLYLRNLGLRKIASFFGAISFAFCGFSVSWMEWGTVLSVAMWLPLILLSTDKLFSLTHSWRHILPFKNVNIIFWLLIFIFSMSASFFAGHFQIFFYVSIVVFFHILFKSSVTRNKYVISLLLFAIAVVFLVISPVLFPAMQFISLSGRELDLSWQAEGWFIPWGHLIQFVIPDFFGNPTTLNYWGVWNYGELVGYIGIIPLIMALFAIFFRRDKKVWFFSVLLFFSLLFSLPTIISNIPFILNIPILSTSQPTRLLFLVDFSLACLAAFGLDYYMEQKNKKIIPIISGMLFLFSIIWIMVFTKSNPSIVENYQVIKSNLIFPSIIVLFASILILLSLFIRNKKYLFLLIILLVSLSVFDLMRFADKFLPFTQKDYLFPPTKTLSYLANQEDKNFRIMTTDSRILPPNFSVMYKLQSIEGYDPLYLRSYAEFISAMERNKPDTSPPYGFNRIISPRNYQSQFINMLNVKYILSFSDISSERFIKIFEEGQTMLFENKFVLPRVFFIKKTIITNEKEQTMKELFKHKNALSENAIVQLKDKETMPDTYTVGTAKIVSYTDSQIEILSNNNGNGFLVISDINYPMWRVTIDGKQEKIYTTNYLFRGVRVPKGTHTIRFYTQLL